MTDSRSWKRNFLEEWLEDTQKQQHVRHKKQVNRLRLSSTMKSGSSRKISHMKGLTQKVNRLSNDNIHLKQCAQALEMHRQSTIDEMILKQARIAFLEEQLRLLHNVTSVLA